MKIVVHAILLFFVILFIWSCERMNGPVEILSLNASDSLVEAGGLLSLKCVAQDEDKDPLAYSWESSSGSFSVIKDSAVWTAPMEYGIYFISCRVTDNYGASDVATVTINVNPSSPVPVNGLEWTLTDDGLLNGTNSSNENNTGITDYWDGSIENADYGWNVTIQDKTENSISQSLQFKVEDSANCGGNNSKTQNGTAIANIQVTGSEPITLELEFSGIGEAESAGYDLIKFELDGVVIGDGHAPGGGLGCASDSVAVNPASPKSLDPGPHTLIIDFTTNDGQYHVDAYYEIKLKLIAP
ncbi:MAG: hypothetical protein VX586_00395 [Candidatus Neomarinimicrobiota bacterium]|nr:hypothetical protein [Candidatus Neomarinimicrobiota bacterium]